MVLTIEWRNGNTGLPNHDLMLIAFPGVGNVGKAAIDAVNSVNKATQVARLYDTSLPPLACLDEDGLLVPPHYTLSSIESTTGKVVLTLTGTTQPVDPNSQGLLANDIMRFFMKQGVKELVVMAGLGSEPSRKETFVVASNASHRIELESRGVDVRRDEPSSGAIGLTALLASSGPLYEIDSCLAIATTVGASGDVMASQRLLDKIDNWFELGISLPSDTSANLLAKLQSMAPEKAQDVIAELTDSADAFYN